MRMTSRTSLAVITTIAAIAVLFTPTGARADVRSEKSNNYSQGFATVGTTLMVSPNFCIRWAVRGVINYRAREIKVKRNVTQPGTTVYGYAIDRVKLSSHQVEVTTFAPRSGKCTSKRKNYASLQVQEKVRAYSCSWNPQITVGAPWSLGLGFWPSCGNKNLASWGFDVKRAGSHHLATNMADTVKFPGAQEQGNWFTSPQTRLKWSCYGASARITVSVRGASNVMETPRIKICPGWGGSRAGW
ncbi:hypothetical protein ABFU82_04780 [Nocardioides sp. WV_118_6]